MFIMGHSQQTEWHDFYACIVLARSSVEAGPLESAPNMPSRAEIRSQPTAPTGSGSFHNFQSLLTIALAPHLLSRISSALIDAGMEYMIIQKPKNYLGHL